MFCHIATDYKYKCTIKDIKAGRNFVTTWLSSLGSLKSCESIICQAERPSANIRSNNTKTALSRGNDSVLIRCNAIFTALLAKKLTAYGSHSIILKSPKTCSCPLCKCYILLIKFRFEI